MKSYASVEDYIAETGEWADAMTILRELFLTSGLSETIKWGGPVYTFESKNIVGMASFKAYAGIWFYQGALLKDEKKKLINAQEGVTKALRQWRFGSAEEIRSESQTIREYIAEAIINQQQGKEIKADKNKLLVNPVELEEILGSDSVLKSCFDSLSLTNRRDYAEYIATAKRPETRQERLKKIVPMILRGEGMNDKYKK